MIMDLYIKGDQRKYRDQIVILTIDPEDGEEYQTINPTEEMILADGWTKYVLPEPTIEDLRNLKLQEIKDYDKSPEVNTFYVGGIALWLSREERIVIKDRFQREKDAGKEKTKLIYQGLTLELAPDMGIQLINLVSAYADECFDVTEAHKSSVNALSTEEEINNYDYTTGYPEKINITL